VDWTKEGAIQPTKLREYLSATNPSRGGVRGYSQDDDEHLPLSTDAADRATNNPGAATNISGTNGAAAEFIPPTPKDAAIISGPPRIISGPSALISEADGCILSINEPLPEICMMMMSREINPLTV
jgi:hypothetical protein